jgi:hypothetical protein
MLPSNFDFGGFVNDDHDNDSDNELNATDAMSVRAVLGFKFGERRGDMIYKMLERLAKKAANSNGGLPGLLFTEEGGEFVSFHDNNSNRD